MESAQILGSAETCLTCGRDISEVMGHRRVIDQGVCDHGCSIGSLRNKWKGLSGNLNLTEESECKLGKV